MTRLWLVVALVSGCLFTSNVRADVAEGTGFEAGLRLGYGIPLGTAAAEGSFSDLVGGQIPLIIDVGYRALPNLFVGLYLQYGFAWVGGAADDACDASDEVSCSAHDLRFGVEGHYHFMPGQKLDPWAGVGFGYEWASVAVDSGGVEVSTGFSGFEFINLQGGLDIAVAPQFHAGPFLSLSIAQFSDLSIDCSTGSSGVCRSSVGANGDIPDKALHEWLLIGVRGTYGP